jgi:hypothetical protein
MRSTFSISSSSCSRPLSSASFLAYFFITTALGSEMVYTAWPRPYILPDSSPWRPSSSSVQVAAQLCIVVIVGHVGLYVAEHLHYLGVGAAVERAFKGTYGRGDCAVCVGAGGGHAAAGEGGVVAAAVVGVEHQHHVQDVGFLVGVALVRAHHAQEVFRQGQLRLRVVDIKRMAQQVVPHDGIGVGHDKGHPRHDLHRLAQHVGGGSVVGAGVVGIQGQHASGQLVHKIVGRCLEDYVLSEADGQIACLGQQSLEAFKLGLVWQLAQQQKIHGLLIAEGAGFQVCLHNVGGIDASVIKLARHWDAFAVYDGVALHAAYARDADDDAGAVGIAQTALYVHMCVLFVVYVIRGHNVGIQLLQVLLPRHHLCGHHPDRPGPPA